MIGINRKDIQAILKAGAKAIGMSTSEFKAEIQATIDNIINSSDMFILYSKKIRRLYFSKDLS